MKSRTTPQSFKIDHAQNVGTVVLVVEGQADEFRLLEHIIHKILNYTLVSRPRGKANFTIHSEYTSKRHNSSKIIVVNARNSNIKNTLDSGEYINKLYKDLLTVYNIDIKNKAVFYLWDRDRESNISSIVLDALSVLTNPYGDGDNNATTYENGLLLLSFPKLEAYTMSNFTDIETLKDIDPKEYTRKNLKISDITESTLLTAVCNMHKKFIKSGIKDYNLDNFIDTNMKIYNYQEEFFENNQTDRLISLLSIIFLYLGIIKIKE